MKVLLTGMTSGHTSKKAHQANLGFFGVLDRALSEAGHDVVWSRPNILWTSKDLETFDAVFVGLVPPTSLSANQAYGALGLIEELYTSSKLHLVVDNPQHWLIKSSLKSVLSDIQSLVKPFYKKRSEYLLAKEPKNLDKMLHACELLLTETWPTTIYPGLPWKSDESVSEHLPSGASSSVVGLNFDVLLLNPERSEVERVSSHWAVSNPKTKWAQKIANNTSIPIKPLKASKKDTDQEAMDTLRSSVGLLVAPQDRIGGTWWSPSYVQAINTLTPVATEWRESSSISASWSLLPSSIEDLTIGDRIMLAVKQREDYISAIPDREESLETLQILLTQITRS